MGIEEGRVRFFRIDTSELSAEVAGRIWTRVMGEEGRV